MDGNLWIDLAGLFFLLLGGAFFSASETALTAASRARMHALEDGGNARAWRINRLRERKDRMISTLLFGNTIMNILLSSLATVVLMRMFGAAGIAYATIGVTIMVLIFAEVLPKTYALLNPERLSLFLVPAVAGFVALFSPITYAVNKLVKGCFGAFGVHPRADGDAHEEELRGAIQLFKEKMNVEGGQEQGAMLRSIMDLAEVEVSEIMVHRKNVRMINADLPPARLVDEVLHSSFTRLPVWKENPDNIIGVIHTKLLLNEIINRKGDISKINILNAMMEPWFIPEKTTLFDQLQAFRKRREHFSIMVDEYGALMGVVSLEDILEEIVGEISDEHDVAVTGVRPQADGSYIIDGKVTIRDLNREFDWGLPDEEYATLAGLILFESQRVPSVGQTFTFFGFRFEIIKKQKNQISLVRVTPVPEEGESAEIQMERIG
ncbi:MAG: HlyC/CorC family transporter [Alphaproteobacteria bacterium]|nr:HlyC/CorC family transporter [Alphaproteobacteria bacterium]